MEKLSNGFGREDWKAPHDPKRGRGLRRYIGRHRDYGFGEELRPARPVRRQSGPVRNYGF